MAQIPKTTTENHAQIKCCFFCLDGPNNYENHCRDPSSTKIAVFTTVSRSRSPDLLLFNGMVSVLMNKTVCINCFKKVTDRGVEFDSDCKRWFQPECVKLSSVEYKKITDGVIKTWTCDRMDCVDKPPDALNDLNAKVTALVNQFQQLATKNEINDGISSLMSDIQTLFDKLDAMEPRLVRVETKTLELEQKIENLNLGVSDKNDLIAEVNDRSNRARNIIIYKIPDCSSISPDLKKKHDSD
ncbi:hypothetical protein J6590_003995 [Homalodisca vitripennis]|nr:hypothetical protein J6590_003995 [Homalodisca vitripennis]